MQLVSLGYDTATIASITLDPANRISEKPREQGRVWLAHDIARAQGKHAEEKRTRENAKQEQPTRAQPDTEESPPAEDTDSEELRSARGIVIQLAAAILTSDHFAQDTSERLFVYAEGAYQPSGERHIRRRVKALLTTWKQSKLWSSHRAHEVIEYIRADAPFLWEEPRTATVNVLNGLLNPHTRELSPHSPTWLSALQLPLRYDPAATSPAWDAFIADVFPKDAPALGYEIPADLIIPLHGREQAFLFDGDGGNGKSTYLAALLAFVGRRNCTTLSLQKIESDRFAAARLQGKLANICPDLPSSHLAGTSAFKAITGGDFLTGEHKFTASFDFRPHLRLVFSANRPPMSGDDSEGFYQRWIVVPFSRTFRGTKAEVKRNDMDARLASPAELSGVLNHALDALPGLRRNGFTTSDSLERAHDEFRATTDPLSIWLEKTTLLVPDKYVGKGALLAAYNRDCAREKRPFISETAFGLAVKRWRPTIKDGQRTVGGKSTWVWLSLGLIAKEEEHPASAKPGPKEDASTTATGGAEEKEESETPETHH
jgi:putative DNA primase/helicase